MSKVTATIETKPARTTKAYTVPADVLQDFFRQRIGYINPVLALETHPAVKVSEVVEQPAEEIVTLTMPRATAELVKSCVGNVLGSTSPGTPRSLVSEVYDVMERAGVKLPAHCTTDTPFRFVSR